MSLIFLSYAHEDKDSVSSVFLELKEHGLSPWMDKPPPPFESDGLKGGQRWDEVIREKIADAELVLAFFSRISVEKKGYVQREYRLALDASMERPESLPYLVPVLINECEPPRTRIGPNDFHSLQWFKLYESTVARLAAEIAGLVGSIHVVDRGEAQEPKTLEAAALRNQNLLLNHRVRGLQADLKGTRNEVMQLREEVYRVGRHSSRLAGELDEVDKRGSLEDLADELGRASSDGRL